jgi:hypothetical protein
MRILNLGEQIRELRTMAGRIGGSTDERGDMGHPEEIEDQPPSGRKVALAKTCDR